ncbi:hypothetical protein FSP39_003482 [Pinctada imbricata]|uniref:Uncharacterized protein n=1 Tax=Pinctada imbricata TaxID=66713 RepID=A0AA88Y686_PINIB|nr:hypothetical protein FSP39_003482 [Pinctada imbricata]
MNSPSPKKNKSKKVKKHKKGSDEDTHETSLTQTDMTDVPNEEESVEEEEEAQSSCPIQTSLRYSAPEGFMPIDSKDLLTARELQGKELYLISVPEDFDIEELNSRTFNKKNNKTDVHTKKGETYEFLSQTVNDARYHPVVFNKDNKSLSIGTGAEIKGQITITPGMDIPPLPDIPVPPLVKQEIPDGLKIRYQPFGSDDPIIRIEETSTPPKRKKKRKSHLNEEDEQEIMSPSKKKKKKKSRSSISDD